VYTPAPPHAVPAGPLAVRWLGYELPPQRAGATTIGRLQFENAGSAAWRSRPGADIHLSYHWLDGHGNPIVWAGAFILLPERVAAAERVEVWVTVRAPTPPGGYRLAFDLVNEGRYWFRELGNERLELDLQVLPRIERRALTVTLAPGDQALEAATRAALERQEEPIAAADGEATAHLLGGCIPAPDWSRRILDAHAEGYAAVAGSVAVEGGPLERRGAAKELAAWRPGFGRSPGWSLPLVCPSLVAGVKAIPAPGPGGLPALDRTGVDGLALCDGRIRVAVAARALRPTGRRPA
jgi:hypothetical protein